jgi:hypothetical protein
MKTDQIPNIKVQKIGVGKSGVKAIQGFVSLPCWNGHFLVEKPNYVTKTKVVTDGRIQLWVDGEIMENNSFNVAPEQVNAYWYLVENQEEIKRSILTELRTEFPRLLSEDYSAWDHEEGGFPRLEELTPDFDFKNYFGPASVSIAEDTKDDVAYIKWHFECLWDPEHGFQVITHKDRVIDLGQETDIFKINRDNGTYEELQEELKNKVWKLPKKKKWWQFWQ